MNGGDLRTIMQDIGVASYGEVVFIDKEGNTHEVNGFMRTRIPGGGALHIFCESYDFGFDWKASPWPEDLRKFLVEHDLALDKDFELPKEEEK